MCSLRREYPPLSLLQLQKMIDTDRLDTSQPIDLSVICNTGLYTIDPLHKHFGIQLTDEVRQQTHILEYRIIEFMYFGIIFVHAHQWISLTSRLILPVCVFLSLPVLAEPSCFGPPLILVSLYILILTPFSVSLFPRFLLCGQIILYRIYVWPIFSFLHTVEQSHWLYTWDCCLSLTHTPSSSHLANMQLGHLLTCSGFRHLEISLMASPCFFCLLVCSFLVFLVIYYRAFCLYVATIFFCIPVFCPKHACPETKAAFLPLDLPCCGLTTHSGEILITGKSLSLSLTHTHTKPFVHLSIDFHALFKR